MQLLSSHQKLFSNAAVRTEISLLNFQFICPYFHPCLKCWFWRKHLSSGKLAAFWALCKVRSPHKLAEISIETQILTVWCRVVWLKRENECQSVSKPKLDFSYELSMVKYLLWSFFTIILQSCKAVNVGAF